MENLDNPLSQIGAFWLLRGLILDLRDGGLLFHFILPRMQVGKRDWVTNVMKKIVLRITPIERRSPYVKLP